MPRATGAFGEPSEAAGFFTEGTLVATADPLARRAAVVLLAVTMLWGTTFLLTQDLVTDLPVSSFLFLRFAIAAVTLAAMRPGAVARLTPLERRRAVIAGLALSAGFAFQSYGLQHTSATTSGFITGLFVVLTPVMAGVLFRDRVGPRVWWGVGLAVLGLAALSLRGWTVGLGEAVTLAGALAFAVQIALLARWSGPGTAYGIAVVEMAVVALVGLALSPFEGGPQLPTGAGAWAGLAFLGVLASALAFAVQAWAQAHLTGTRTAVIMTGETVWAGVAGVAIGHDPVTARLLLGSVLILTAMYVVELGWGRPASWRGEPAPLLAEGASAP